MTNVSKIKSDSKEFLSLQKELMTILARLNKSSSIHLFNELFTESEQIMITKRFSAILLFKRGYSPYKVWNILHLSPTTAQKLFSAFQLGHYNQMLHSCTEKKIPGIFIFMDKMIRAQGKERWIFLK